jgi:glucose-1-phosphate cytidylyltransferase
VKAVILAGGLGKRLGPLTLEQPKPLVPVAGNPVLWHVLNIYAAGGVRDFVICAGYRADQVAEYGERLRREGWNIRVEDTGHQVSTAGRLRRVRSLLEDGTFCMTYCDGLADVRVDELVRFHRRKGKLATLTAVRPICRFGVLDLDPAGESVERFREKPRLSTLWVNGGFFVLEPAALDLIEDEEQPWENGPMERLVERGQISAFRHEGFWYPMDSPSERRHLEELWQSGRAPWKIW